MISQGEITIIIKKKKSEKNGDRIYLRTCGGEGEKRALHITSLLVGVIIG